uniref:Uncharacterized protein n=1 Tax=Proboscia inermis TaxID=420281 RepID=A0A7S0C0M3_9STRA|mmetsp:Transcript_24650/g.30296  ORF Transcript_24650/g.30296 Transcript_24650/m.30296 type:complete len:114 (+) Transcript_24650:374-715(+)
MNIKEEQKKTQEEQDRNRESLVLYEVKEKQIIMKHTSREKTLEMENAKSKNLIHKLKSACIAADHVSSADKTHKKDTKVNTQTVEWEGFCSRHERTECWQQSSQNNWVLEECV